MVYFQWNKAMIERFLNDPLANSLAVIVLVALVASWVASLVLTLRDEPLPLGKSWYAWLLPLLPLPGIPAAFDLLRTGGLTFVLAAVVFLVLITSIVVPGLRLYGKIDLSLVRDWPRWAIPLLVVGGLAVAGYLTFVDRRANRLRSERRLCARAGKQICHPVRFSTRQCARSDRLSRHSNRVAGSTFRPAGFEKVRRADGVGHGHSGRVLLCLPDFSGAFRDRHDLHVVHLLCGDHDDAAVGIHPAGSAGPGEFTPFWGLPVGRVSSAITQRPARAVHLPA
jgi:hypothetical protein